MPVLLPSSGVTSWGQTELRKHEGKEELTGLSATQSPRCSSWGPGPFNWGRFSSFGQVHNNPLNTRDFSSHRYPGSLSAFCLGGIYLIFPDTCMLRLVTSSDMNQLCSP